jgi:Arc/MetJ-type ribon-helix-helix transcriptional regulator
MKRSNNLMIFRVPQEIKKRIEELVERGIYKTKSEIVNEALRNYFGLNRRKVKRR